LYVAILSNLEKWATGEGSFVVVSLLEGLSGDQKDEMISLLKKSKKYIKSQGGDNKGTKIVLEKIA
jgi:pumilio homology domain family member 6